jgi:hypothetical protein
MRPSQKQSEQSRKNADDALIQVKPQIALADRDSAFAS